MPTLYYLVDPQDAPEEVRVLGPYRTSGERDAARAHPEQLPLEFDPTPHPKNPNGECLLALAGLEDGVLDVSGPYLNAEERRIAMLRSVWDGQPYVVALDVRRGVVAHTASVEQSEVDLDSQFIYPEPPDPDDPVREEDAFLDWLHDLEPELLARQEARVQAAGSNQRSEVESAD